MNCNNGMTYVNTCIPAPGATATDATYVLDLTHYLCGNRKVCVNAAYPLTANLNYQVRGIEDVGNKTFNCDILVYGTVTYMPHKQGCNPCRNSLVEHPCQLGKNRTVLKISPPFQMKSACSPSRTDRGSWRLSGKRPDGF